MLRIASSLTTKRLSAVAAITTTTAGGGALIAYNATKQHTSTTSTTSCSALLDNTSTDTTIPKRDNQDAKLQSLSNSDKSDHQEENVVEQIRPIVQASQRALRLVQTVTMIVLEYKLDSYQHKLNSSLQSLGVLDNVLFTNAGNELQRQNLEQDVQEKLDELQEAQRIYAEPSPTESKSNSSSNTKEEIEERKLKNRKAVHDAAEKLSEAENNLAAFMKGIASTSSSSSTSSTVHERAATRLRDLCRTNGGTYIKVGQHIANLDHLLPQAYITILQSLFRDCPITPYEDIRQVVKEELGDYPETIFAEFDKEPIASASLAQVHVAKEKGSGRKLAIKVQHRGLRETSRGDLLALEYVVRVVDRMFDEFKWGWLVDEISPNVSSLYFC